MSYLDKFGRGALALLTAALLVPLAGCDSLIEVEDPDIITPESLTGPVGLSTRFNGAVGDFTLGYSGGCCPGSFFDSFVTMGGLMSDEMYLSGTFPTRTEVDQRDVAVTNGTMAGVFRRMHEGRVAAEETAEVLAAEGEGDRPGLLRALAGYMYIGFADLFCSGVPFSKAPPEGELEFGSQATTAEMYNIAIDRFDEAMTLASDPSVVNLARVGKARAQLSNGDFAGAAATVAAVPTDFMFVVDHSDNSNRQRNAWFSASWDQRRQSVADVEGLNGMPFRSANDPRLTTVENPAGGFDSTSPQFNSMQYPLGQIELSRSAPLPVASGVEARLIEAEAAHNGGDFGTALATLNALRATMGMAPLADPGTATGRVDLLFAERAWWLYSTGQRLGDLRRLVRQYGRDQASVLPTGAYFKGGSFGTDVNLPVPEEEQNNPNFEQCLDRNA